jgi:hypothetical protein
MHAQMQSWLRRPLVIFCIKAGITKAINIEYNASRANKAKLLAGWVASQWPELLGNLAKDATVHEAAFHEVSPECPVSVSKHWTSRLHGNGGNGGGVMVVQVEASLKQCAVGDDGGVVILR